MKSKTQKSEPKLLNHLTHQKVLRIAGIALVGIVVLAQVAFDARMYFAVQPLQNNSQIGELIISAAQNLQKPAVIDGRSKQVYLPDANLTLPFYPSGAQGVNYYYTPAFDNSDATVNVTTTHAFMVAASKLRAQATQAGWNTSATTKTFDLVPELQACGRGMTITLTNNGSKPRETGADQDGSKRLKDGRTAYFRYDSSCHQQPAGISDYFKQVESY